MSKQNTIIGILFAVCVVETVYILCAKVLPSFNCNSAVNREVSETLLQSQAHNRVRSAPVKSLDSVRTLTKDTQEQHTQHSVSTIPPSTNQDPRLEAIEQKARGLGGFIIKSIERSVVISDEEQKILEDIFTAKIVQNSALQLEKGEEVEISWSTTDDVVIEKVLGSERYNAYKERSVNQEQSHADQQFEMRLYYVSRKLNLTPEQESTMAKIYADVDANFYRNYLDTVLENQRPKESDKLTQAVMLFRKEMMLSRLKNVLSAEQLNRYAKLQEE